MFFWIVQPGHSACGNGHCNLHFCALRSPYFPIPANRLRKVIITAAASSYTVHLPLYLMAGKQFVGPKATSEKPSLLLLPWCLLVRDPPHLGQEALGTMW